MEKNSDQFLFLLEKIKADVNQDDVQDALENLPLYSNAPGGERDVN